MQLLRLASSAILELNKQHAACFAGDVTLVSEAESFHELSIPTQSLLGIADDPRLVDNNNFPL